MNPNVLIAFFSRPGNNYVGGSIIDLRVGNTEVLAGKIHESIGGDLFRIGTVRNYPEDYTETTNVAEEEKRNNARPELIDRVDDMGTL